MKPIISVIVSSYNRAESLREALRSLVNQETEGEFVFEILVVDDGSTDNTKKVVEDIGSSSCVPIRYVLEKGRGIPYARNRGIREVQGEWVAIFDDDQLAEPDWLRWLFKTASETGGHIIGGLRRLKLMQDQELRLGPMSRELLGEKYYGQEMHKCSRYSLPSAGNILIKRDIFDIIGNFDIANPRGMTDIDFTRRALEAGLDTWYTPKAVVYHLIPPYRLRRDYFKWTCSRVGTNLALINYKYWGSLRMSLLCLARIMHALALCVPLFFLANLIHNETESLERQCYIWVAVANARMALHLIMPKIFPQKRFMDQLEFRQERRMAGFYK